MKGTLKHLAIVIVLALASGWLSGCARQVSNEPVPQSRSDTAPASSVELVQSGGVAGVMNTWEVSSQGAPPRGMSAAEAREVLHIASSQEFRSLSPQVVPTDYCCDFFHYSVTVRYSDGSTLRYQTAQGLDRPEPLTALIGAFG